MGVIETIPDDLSVFYGDDYYGNSDQRGYLDYSFMAEHGVAWAAALLPLISNGGRILDIGCVDGHLLSKLGPRFEQFGIEVNPEMCHRAEANGVRIIGRDLLDRELRQQYRNSFDIVTSIAVFEHLPDIREGVEVCLELLKDDGILVFEVPLISTTKDNSSWFNSSLEHVFYPSERSIWFLAETELAAHLIGAECYVRDYASTYIGVIAKHAAVLDQIAGPFGRVVAGPVGDLMAREVHARFFLHLIHAAQSSPELVSHLAALSPELVGHALLRRLGDIWAADLRRLSAALNEREELVNARDWHANQTKAVQAVHLATNSFPALAARLAELSPDLAGHALLRHLGSVWAADLAERQELVEARDQHAAQAEAARTVQRAAEEEIARLQAIAAARIAEMEFSRAELSLRAARLDVERHGLQGERNRSTAEKERLLKRIVDLKRERTRDAARSRHLTDEMATIARDRRLNVSQMISAMAQAEQRVQSLDCEVSSLRTSLTAIQASSSWKLTGPLRRFGMRYPKFARLPRRAAKAIWWTRRGELNARIHEPDVPAHIASSSVEPDIRLLPFTGIAEPIISDYPEPWPADRPLVSIVIPCFNYGHFVGDAVDSALGQTLRDIEIIVVEGGSTAMESRQALAELDQPGIRVILQSQSARAGANRNLGISQARGKYICCLDADDRIQPTYLEKAVFLMEHYSYDIVSTALQFFGARTDRVGVMETPDLQSMLEGNQILTCAVFRRELWKRVGGFRDPHPDFAFIHEDWLFWVRLAATGARMFNISREALFEYRKHGPSLSQHPKLIEPDQWAAALSGLNADVLGPDAIEVSRERAAQRIVNPEPHRNLVRDRRDLEAHKPTVLVAVPFLIIGGAERLLSRILKHLTECGWRAIIVSSVPAGPEHGDATSWFAKATKEIYHLPRFLARERWDDFIEYLMCARKPDVLWIVGSEYLYSMLPTLRRKYPTLRVVDLLFNTVGHTANNRKYASEIDLNLVESNEVKEWLIAAAETANRILVVQSGLDTRTYTPGPRDPGIVRALNIDPDSVLVGFSGRWSEEKDPVGFVEIARRVPAYLPVVFVMTGTGAMREQIEDAIRKAGFPLGRFHLVGLVEDVQPYIRSLDLLVLPSRLDGRPVVVLEALSMGVAVIASRIGGLPDLITTGSTGYLCDPGDYDEFARRITELARDTGKLDVFKATARRFAESNLDESQMLREYERALQTNFPEISILERMTSDRATATPL